MKTNAIVRIVIWSLVLILLIGVFGSSFAYTAARENRNTEVTFSPGRVDGENRNTEATLSPTRENSSTAQTEAAVPLEQMFTFPADQVSELEIEWVAGNITIYPTDRTEITISEAGNSKEKYSMVHRLRNGQLSIEFCDENIVFGLGRDIQADLSKDLYVYVPEGWVCRSLEIEAAAADMRIWNMTIDELDIDGASGKCDLENCKVGKLDVDTASGDVIFSGSLNSLDFDAASANFTGVFTNTPSRMDMDGMSGNLDITLPEDTGYTVNMEGVSSSFQSEFSGTATRNGAHVYGDGRCRIQVDGMSCDVIIRKSQEEGIPQDGNAPTEHQHSEGCYAAGSGCAELEGHVHSETCCNPGSGCPIWEGHVHGENCYNAGSECPNYANRHQNRSQNSYGNGNGIGHFHNGHGGSHH